MSFNFLKSGACFGGKNRSVGIFRLTFIVSNVPGLPEVARSLRRAIWVAAKRSLVSRFGGCLAPVSEFCPRIFMPQDVASSSYHIELFVYPLKVLLIRLTAFSNPFSVVISSPIFLHLAIMSVSFFTLIIASDSFSLVSVFFFRGLNAYPSLCT